MKLLARSWQNRWIRRLAWAVVTLVTLYALLCAWVNWSGARQLRATQALLEAEGETLDFRATMNEPLPEAENFCAIPLLKDLALGVDTDSRRTAKGENRRRLESLQLANENQGAPRPKFTNAPLGKRADLKAWAGWLRKKDEPAPSAESSEPALEVLAALSKHDAVVQELAAGLPRVGAQWTPEWKTRELPPLLPSLALPQYSAIQAVNQSLALRAIAAAQAGDWAKAHESALIIARLDQACLNDPFLIGLLVGASGAATLQGTTWELCAAHAGTPEDFARLESALRGLDFQRASLHAWRSELAAMVDTVQYIKTQPDRGLGLFQVVSSIDGRLQRNASSEILARTIPLGFFDASAAVLANLEFRHIVKPLKEHGWQHALASGKDLEDELNARKQKIWAHPAYFMAAMIVPASRAVMARCAYTQALVNQAAIACALERQHIAHGRYPDSLDSVRLADGNPLPPDPLNGQPMHYRQTAGERYALWSVGFDGRDDEGKRVLKADHPEETKLHDAAYVGDWVWDFPVSKEGQALTN